MSNRDQTGGRERGNRSHERLPAFGAIAVSAAGASAPRGDAWLRRRLRRAASLPAGLMLRG